MKALDWLQAQPATWSRLLETNLKAGTAIGSSFAHLDHPRAGTRFVAFYSSCVTFRVPFPRRPLCLAETESGMATTLDETEQSRMAFLIPSAGEFC
jgi:hypothetical protein